MQNENKPEAGGRLDGLDVLRALAIVLVLCAHMLKKATGYPAPISTLVDVLRHVGWAGVDLFFVLSGFLVSGLLFREHQRFGSIELGRFLARRGFKIYPPLYTVVLAYFVYHHLLGHPGEGGNLYADALFIGSYVASALCGTWSLAVEEHFYVFLALIVYLLNRRQARSPFAPLVPLALLLVVVCTGLRVWTSRTSPQFGLLTHHYATHLRMDTLMFGVLLSYLYHYHREPLLGLLDRCRGWVLVSSLLCISPILFHTLGKSPFLDTYGLTLLYVGMGGLVLLAATAQPGAVPLSKRKWVLAIGRDSYSIYLWHMEVVFHVWPLLQQALPTTAATTRIFADPFFRMGGALLFGRLMAYLVEARFLRLRERLFPARAAVTAPRSDPLPAVVLPTTPAM